MQVRFPFGPTRHDIRVMCTIVIHLSGWPSGLRRCVQVAVYSCRRGFESHSWHLFSFSLLRVPVSSLPQEWCEKLILMQDIIDAWLKVSWDANCCVKIIDTGTCTCYVERDHVLSCTQPVCRHAEGRTDQNPAWSRMPLTRRLIIASSMTWSRGYRASNLDPVLQNSIRLIQD